MKLEKIVELAFRHKPETIASNDLLWVEVCKALCKAQNITNLDDFFLKILGGDIPSSHTLAAKITNVRKKYPELRPTQEQMKLKKVVKQQYIEDYRNA
jgi:hypothetical protein